MKTLILAAFAGGSAMALAQDISAGAAPVSAAAIDVSASATLIDQPAALTSTTSSGPTPPVGPEAPVGPSWPLGPSWPSGPTWPVAPKPPIGPAQLLPLLAHLPLQPADPQSPQSPADPLRPSYWLLQATTSQGGVSSAGSEAPVQAAQKLSGVAGEKLSESLQNLNNTVTGLFNVVTVVGLR